MRLPVIIFSAMRILALHFLVAYYQTNSQQFKQTSNYQGNVQIS